MIRDEHLDQAVAIGAITAEQAGLLRELARKSDPLPLPSDPKPDPDDERFRLIGGFNDVFVTIGVGLLVSALFALSSALGLPLGFAAVGVIAAWGLSEVFARRMRLALPSIALAVMFAGAAGILVMMLYELTGLGAAAAVDQNVSLRYVLVGAGAAIAAAVHQRRFHVPIDAAIIAVSLVMLAYGALSMAAPEWTTANVSLLMGLFGLAVFAAAVRIDATDPERVTRRSDMAFWLHLVAAPMIVHAVIPSYGSGAELDARWAAFVLALFAVLALVAIVVDRRALLVSGLSYAGIALAYLLTGTVGQNLRVSVTLLALAALVLGLSVGWRSLRGTILPALPLGQLRRYVPPAV